MDRFIYSTYDAGAVATFDNFVYVKQGNTFEKPNRSCKEPDIVDIKSLQFNRDDNNDENGSVHKVWTNVEIAISNLPQFTTRVWKNPTVAANSLITPMAIGEQILDYGIRYEVPTDGIARIIIYNNVNVTMNTTIKINGFSMLYTLKENATQRDANAYKVVAGDVIEVTKQYARVILLPYDYTV